MDVHVASGMHNSSTARSCEHLPFRATCDFVDFSSLGFLLSNLRRPTGVTLRRSGGQMGLDAPGQMFCSGSGAGGMNSLHIGNSHAGQHGHSSNFHSHGLGHGMHRGHGSLNNSSYNYTGGQYGKYGKRY